MSWIYLVIAGLFEVIWAVSLKQSTGFSKFLPLTIMGLGILFSVWFLGLAMRHISLGTAYSIWTGIGVVGSMLFGTVLYNEQINIWRAVSVIFLVLGMLGVFLTEHS